MTRWVFFIALILIPIAYAQADEEDTLAGVSYGETPSFMPRTDLTVEERLAVLERQVNRLMQQQKNSDIPSLKGQLSQLQGRLEVLEHQQTTLQEQLKQQYQDLNERLEQKSKLPIADESAVKKTAGDSTANAAKASKPSNLAQKEQQLTRTDKAVDKKEKDTTDASQAKLSYLKALKLLQQKDYVRAIPALENFLARYPKSDLKPNAHFWLAEVQLLQGQPDVAIEQYRILIKSYPKNDKTPLAQAKLGMAYWEQGNTKQALAQWRQVIKQYPKTEAAKVAQQQLKAHHKS